MEEDFSHFDLGKDLRRYNALHEMTREKSEDRFDMITGGLLNARISMVAHQLGDTALQIEFLNFINELMDKKMSASSIQKQIDLLNFSTYPKMEFRVRSGVTRKQFFDTLSYLYAAIFVVVVLIYWFYPALLKYPF